MSDDRFDQPWRQKAGCRGMDGDVFYPREGQRHDPIAKATCDACPVRTECLDDAVTYGEMLGTWGGMTARERVLWLRRVRRASSA